MSERKKALAEVQSLIAQTRGEIDMGLCYDPQIRACREAIRLLAKAVETLATIQSKGNE